MYPPDGYTTLVVRKNKGLREQCLRKSRRHGVAEKVVEFMPADFGTAAQRAYLDFAGRLELRSQRMERWRRLLSMCRIYDELDRLGRRQASLSRRIERANESAQPALSARAGRNLTRAISLIKRVQVERRILGIT